jgi:hypothetical protein
MALTAVDYHVLEALRKADLLPARPSVLELGESEWYGDIPPQELAAIIDGAVAQKERRAALRRELQALLDGSSPTRGWDLAKVFYAAMLDYRQLVAIDYHGTPAAKQIDLNAPVDLGQRFDMVIDGGTSEHVFNVFQFYKTCHDLTRPGGLMLHNNPFRGWLEHGFYSFNPTFYWDLAGANRYEMLMLVYHEADPLRVEQLLSREKIVEMARAGGLGANAMLYAVYRKPPDEAPFAIPRQGYYANALSEQMARAWSEVR